MNQNVMSLTGKSAFIWNMLGSSMNAAMTMLLTVATAQIVSADASGILGLAFGIGSFFGCVASFEVRAYQATDRLRRFSFGEYLAMRLITCGVGTLACFLFLLTLGYDAAKAQVVFFVCLFKIIEAVSDVFQGFFQSRDRIDLAGKSMFYRTLGASLLYIAVLFLTGSPVASALTMPLVSLLYLALYDVRILGKLNEKLRITFSKRAIRSLFIECWSLAASAIMGMYLLNIEKLLVDRYIPHLQAAWTALFMPAAFINLFVQFFFKPILTGMTDIWNSHQFRRFKALCLKLCGGIVLLCAVIVVLGEVVGLPLLQLLYKTPLSGYSVEFALILIGGGFNALAVFLWYVLIMIRKQHLVIWGDLAAFFFALFLMPSLVDAYQIMGASLGYLLSMLIRTLVCIIFAAICIYRSEKSPEHP